MEPDFWRLHPYAVRHLFNFDINNVFSFLISWWLFVCPWYSDNNTSTFARYSLTERFSSTNVIWSKNIRNLSDCVTDCATTASSSFNWLWLLLLLATIPAAILLAAIIWWLFTLAKQSYHKRGARKLANSVSLQSSNRSSARNGESRFDHTSFGDSTSSLNRVWWIIQQTNFVWNLIKLNSLITSSAVYLDERRFSIKIRI